MASNLPPGVSPSDIDRAAGEPEERPEREPPEPDRPECNECFKPLPWRKGHDALCDECKE